MQSWAREGRERLPSSLVMYIYILALAISFYPSWQSKTSETRRAKCTQSLLEENSGQAVRQQCGHYAFAKKGVGLNSSHSSLLPL